MWFPDVQATTDETILENENLVQLELDETPDPKILTGEEVFEEFLKTAKYFDETYPGDKIDEDFSEDIEKQFPELSAQEVFDYQGYIRSGLKAYRLGKKLYGDYIEAKLTPEEPPLILPDREFDLSSPKREYIDSGDETLVIEDFKKVISYSQNPREIKAYRAKIERDFEKKGKWQDFDEIGYIFSKLEFKKFFFYNLFYENPLTGKHGIGKWVKKDDFKIRLITELSRIPENKKINGLIHLMLPENLYIAALNGKNFHKPEVSFKQSENLKNIQVYFPLPNRLKNKKIDFPLYSGELAFPFVAEVIDKEQTLHLKADVKIDLCSADNKCETLNFTPELEIYTGKNRDSAVAVYVRRMQNFLIPQIGTKAHVENFYIEKLISGQHVLTLKMNYPEKVKAFNVFAGNNKEQSFERPRVNIDGKKIVARFVLVDSEISLDNEPVEIFGLINKNDAFHFSLIPHLGRMDSDNENSLNWTIFMAAILGGFLLNFMPCVFPVLSLKILSLTKFGARNEKSVKKSFNLTLLGI